MIRIITSNNATVFQRCQTLLELKYNKAIKSVYNWRCSLFIDEEFYERCFIDVREAFFFTGIALELVWFNKEGNLFPINEMPIFQVKIDENSNVLELIESVDNLFYNWLAKKIRVDIERLKEIFPVEFDSFNQELEFFYSFSDVDSFFESTQVFGIKNDVSTNLTYQKVFEIIAYIISLFSEETKLFGMEKIECFDLYGML